MYGKNILKKWGNDDGNDNYDDVNYDHDNDGNDGGDDDANGGKSDEDYDSDDGRYKTTWPTTTTVTATF